MSKLEFCELGDLIEFQRGYDLPKGDFVAGPYPVQSSNGILGYHNKFKVKGPGITIGRSGTVGIPHFLEDNFFPHNTALFIKDFKGNDVRYIYYLLKYLKLGDKKSGSGVPTMNRNHLHPLKIKSFRDVEYQNKLSSVLYTIDKKIELNNRINAELEAMAKTLYDYWFMQFDFPDDSPQGQGKPYKTSGGKMVYNPTLKREIPEGWADCILGDHVTFKRGISYKSGDIQDEGVPFLNLNSFSLSGEFKQAGTKYYNGKFKPESKLEAGELVIAITDVTRNADIIGKAFVIPDIFDEKPLISCDVACVSSKTFGEAYLEQLFNSESYHKYIKHFASGTLVLHLDLQGVKWFKTHIPPRNLLNKYNQHCDSLFKQRDIVLKENIYLESLRDWLLPMLMNGQVAVK
jgi:type I restriction enzyme, S subunit